MECSRPAPGDGLPPDWVCPSKGRFAHRSNCTLYLKCLGAGYEPCLCHCKYKGMHFDSPSRRCDMKAPGKRLRICKHLRVKPQQSVDSELVYTSGNGSENRDQFLERVEVDISRSTAETLPPAAGKSRHVTLRSVPQRHVISDPSAFPAWGVAFLVMGLVLLMILIVLILY